MRQSLGKFTLAAWSAGVTCWKRRISAEASRDATRGPVPTIDGLSTRHANSSQSFSALNMRLTPRLNLSITICGEKHRNCRAPARRPLTPWHSATALRKVLAVDCMCILSNGSLESWLRNTLNFFHFAPLGTTLICATRQIAATAFSYLICLLRKSSVSTVKTCATCT